MIDFYELEKRCKRKKIKKILFWIFVVILIGGILFVYLKFNKDKTTKTPIKQEKIVVKKREKKEKNKSLNIEKTKVIKKIHKMEKEINNSIKKQKIIKPKPKIIKQKQSKSVTAIETIPYITYHLDLEAINDKKSIKKPIKILHKEESKKLVIEVKDNKNYLPEEAQKKLNNIIKKANHFYNKALYYKTIELCELGANIDNSNEELWELYAKSLNNIGKKEKAIKVLKTYLRYKNSERLKLLLERLEK